VYQIGKVYQIGTEEMEIFGGCECSCSCFPWGDQFNIMDNIMSECDTSPEMYGGHGSLHLRKK
jgi:hypothetical protein